VGDNGAGKTSVLESVVVLAKGRSFRSGQISSLIGSQAESFRVVAKIEQTGARIHTLGLERSRSEWKARRNGSDVQQLSDLAVDLPLVLIEPNSHQLISGAPEGRRRFIDWGVFHVEPDYLVTWRRYARALKQRNAALRRQQRPVAESLDGILSDMGEHIAESRRKQVQCLSGRLKEAIQRLSPDLSGIKLKYDSGWKGGTLANALQESLDKDLDRGATGPGPHRADLQIFQNNRVAKERLSRGEQKVLSSALLLTQAGLMSESGETPLLLLDDLASEFDESHLMRVMSFARDLGGQIIITGTSVDEYFGDISDAHRLFHVEHGKIVLKTST
jgi:DNA replication and repair protein RecF